MSTWTDRYANLQWQIDQCYESLDAWEKMDSVDLASYYSTPYEAVESMPSAVITKSRTGNIIGTDILTQAPQEFNPPAVVNSNVPAPYYGTNGQAYYINGSANTSGGTTTFTSGAKKVGTGTKVLTTVSKVASVGIAASLGAKLGKRITESAYDAGYEWGWTEADWDNWASGLDPLDQTFFRTLFDIDSQTGTTTAYVPEEMLALEYLEMLKKGCFELGETVSDNTDVSRTRLNVPDYDYPSRITIVPANSTKFKYATGNQYEYKFNVSSSGNVYSVAMLVGTEIRIWLISNTGFSGEILRDGTHFSNLRVDNKVVNNNRYYYTSDYYGGDISIMSSCTAKPSDFPSDYPWGPTGVLYAEIMSDTGYLVFNGDEEHVPAVTGIEDDDRATTFIDPTLITGTTPQTVLPQLKQNYPQLFDGSITEEVPQEDGTSKTITYLPIPWFDKSPEGNPITGIPSQTDPQVDPQTATTDMIKDVIDTLTDFITNPPTTGTGDSPITALPVGEASSLWKIYNPTQAQVDAFGSWLWSSNFVEQIKKLFNDPMQGIIGIHKVFATPSIGGSTTIKVGYLDSEVPSNWVDDQYTTVNCGTVNLREYFGNVFDYAPYTRVSLYLPFIGIVDLDVADVMRASINVTYHVDVLSGACVADVKVIRDACGGVLYQYSGSAIVTYPVSSGNYMGMVAGVLSVASGIAGTVLSGGALAPALIGGAVGASHLHTNVSHSGGFSGCAGAMAGKKPYLIISRPQTALADSYEHFTGKPANAHVTLKKCGGMTRVKSVYVGNMNATDEEKNLIEAQLKSGVLV